MNSRDAMTWLFGLCLIVLIVSVSNCARAATLNPAQCIALGSAVQDIVILREVGGDVDKHVALLRRVNPSVDEAILTVIEGFVRKGYANENMTPEALGEEAMRDCFARGGVYPPKVRM